MSNLLLVVIGMAIVTYIPRMIPMLVLKNVKLPAPLQRFLTFVPYAVIASLIFPGILTSVEHVQSAIVGGIISCILALLRCHLLMIILGGILGVFVSDQLLV